jgi:hypothetical protein
MPRLPINNYRNWLNTYSIKHECERTKSHKHKDGWSPMFICLKIHLHHVNETRGRIFGQCHRRQWKQSPRHIISHWLAMLNRITSDSTIILRSLSTCPPPERWMKFTPEHLRQMCSTIEFQLFNRMHGRKRLELRSQINQKVVLRELNRIRLRYCCLRENARPASPWTNISQTTCLLHLRRTMHGWTRSHWLTWCPC